MAFFPMYISLEHEDVLVIGTGRIAAHKIQILESFGAVVTALEQIGEEEIEAVLSEKNWAVVVCSVQPRQVQRALSDACRRKRIPVNVVDVPEYCSFIFPCIERQGDIVLSVSSSGKSPLVARKVRDSAKKALSSDLGTINDIMGSIRPKIRRDFAGQKDRKEAYRIILEELEKRASDL